MLPRTFPLTTLLCACCLLPAAAGEINFVYPPEGASIPDVPRTFVFGNISPSTAAFSINGQKVAVHTNGGFIAYLPIAPGDFAFAGSLDDGTTAQRRLKVKGEPKPAPDEDEVWLKLNTAHSDIEVMPGDPVRIQATGAPGREAVFSINGIVSEERMTESPAGSGRYVGVYRTKPADAGQQGTVVTRFLTGLFRSDAETESRGSVRVLANEMLVETSTDNVVLRNASDGGYMAFLPKGVKLIANGRAGGMRRIMLSQTDSAWVDDSKVQSAGVLPPIPPLTETGAIRTKKADYGTQVTVALYERIPYLLEETDKGVRLTLYYANLRSNWVVYESSDTFVKEVTFRQAATNKAEIEIETDGPVWGYNVSYAGKAMQLELRRPPSPARVWPKPLAGLSVVLDPGHSPKFTPPYDGAIGPKASYEFQVNMAITLKLREQLLALGASVQLTRAGEENLPLAERPKVARNLNGDIFLSVHNNAIGDGEDPFAVPRGYQIYYYHRHSRELAAAIHKAYQKNIALPDEGLRYGDYLVARLTWMPAVLTESAYMIFPQQEEMLNSPAHQEKFARAHTEGILNLFKVPPEPPRKAARRPADAPPAAARPQRAVPAAKRPPARKK